MHVLVNALSVRAPSGEHVLLGHLRQLAGWTLGQHTFLLLHDASQTGWIDQLPPNVQPVCAPRDLGNWSRRILWETFVLPGLLRQWRVELVFTTSGTVLPRCHVPQVSLAQNPWCMVPQIHKGFVARQKAALQRHAYRQAMRKAALMVYNSQHMRDLYQRNAGGAIERASQIVYQAIGDEAHRLAAAPDSLPAKQPGLILAVSVMAAWKGIEVLVDALALLHRQGSRAQLRLVGPWSDARYEKLIRYKVAQARLEPFVTITGRVSKEELYRQYAEAWVYCLMSQCESFGIPAVEAQAFGTPVVAATGCAMPEVCGAGGVYGPPRDPETTAELLGPLLDRGDPWKTLSDKARQNASRYRWELCSRPLLDIFSLGAPA
ncbi:MAG: glycosyltransferase [Thermoguttaceae bacterium]